MHNQDFFKYAIDEAERYLLESHFFHKQAPLIQCESLQELFHFFFQLGLQNFNALYTQEDRAIASQETYSIHQTFKTQNSTVKSKISISTSSDCISKDTIQLSLVQQIQNQQTIIAQLQEKLINTEKMILIGKKLQRQVYSRNMDEAVEQILRKEEQIERLKQQLDLLLSKIQERDDLLEYTVHLLQKRQQNK